MHDPRGIRGRRPDHGAAAVEFALVALILFALIFGIIAFGFALFNQQGAVQAAREAARKAAIGVGNATDCQNALKAGRDAVGSAVESSFTSMTMRIDNNAYRQPVIVQVHYTINFSLVGWLPGVPGNVAATQTARSSLEVGRSFTGNPACTWTAP